MIDALATLSETITRLRPDASNESELGAVNDQLVDVYRRLSSGGISRVAPLRLWIPLGRRPHDEPVDNLIHIRGRARGWPNYDLKLVGEYGERTILLGDIKVEPERETRGLGSAVLTDLCAYADHHRLTVVGMFQPDLEDVGDRSQRTERWYRRHGFDFDGGRMTRPPRVLA
ncbi:MAG: GNAT family N-acetyltransferase [Ilumatobacteraceae bacterium]|nr:GNAT family N-acetyltransferase [Ilumatobacteraceae bacterium]